MRLELSILIPTRDTVCVNLVKSLTGQAEAIEGLKYEIIVADDGSTNDETTQVNKQINKISNCEYIINERNIGRSAIRNYLAKQARYGLLLFIDSGVAISKNDFLRTYLSLYNEHFSVACGGYLPIMIKHDAKNNLRYIYEKKHEKTNSTYKRTLNPYKAFRTVNFIIRKDIMISTPFNINIREYGYEDVMFGKSLSEKHAVIKHIENPVDYHIHDTNEAFLAKTEAALRTLAAHKSELRGYSGLLRTVELLRELRLSTILNAIFKVKKDKWEKCLLGDNPTLFIFNLYRLGYLSSIINGNFR